MTASRVLPMSVLSGTIVSPRVCRSIDDPRQRGDRLGAIAAGIVQQNDAAIAALLFDALQNDIGARPRPILRIDIFEDDEVTQILRDLQRREFGSTRRAGIGGVGRTEKRGRTAGDRLEQKLRRVQFQPDMLRPADREIRMVVGVVPDLVPLGDDSPNEIRDNSPRSPRREKTPPSRCVAFRMSRTCGVHFGSGPSSKVSAT